MARMTVGRIARQCYGFRGKASVEFELFDQLMRLLKAPEPQRVPDLRLSVAVLLVEAARQDDRFEPAERAVIEQLLTRKFDLTQEECTALLAAGEMGAGQMVQLHGHTSAIFEAMTPDERIGVIEMLWEVAYADGVLDPEEDLLIRRVAGLIAVSDRDRVLARQRVLARFAQRT
jgi:uncharacterized tellurite resistance protein B-like protein